MCPSDAVPDGARATARAGVLARAAEARGQRAQISAELHQRLDQCHDALHGLEAELTRAREKIDNLEVALRTSRRIGQAIGIIMERMRVTEDQAFELLRRISQNRHRKLRDIADHVVLTGEIPSAAA
jgi:DNA-directed RNA polymerase sigma subunit (sigma70/sigma32)